MKKIIIIVILIVIIAIFLFPNVSLSLKSIGASINLIIPSGDWRPLEIFTKDPVKEEHIIDSISGRTLTLHVYKLKESPPESPALIIYTPFIGGGLEDQRLVNLLKTFARLGFITAAPLRSEGSLVVSKKDIDDVISSVTFFEENPSFDIKSYGLFGISYGSGPVIIAADDPRISHLVDFVVSFGGYFELQNLLEFIASGEYSYKDISDKTEPDPYAHQILEETLDYYDTDRQTMINTPKFAKLKYDLSPSNFINQPQTDFLIIHSTDDNFIPYTESMRLYDALRDQASVQFVLTNALEHGTYKKLNFQNIRQAYLPSAADFYKLIYRLLSEHGS